MAASFDPYHKWLGIAPQEQPPHHYRLLGIPLFEPNADVIEAAADRQMAHLRTYQTGKQGAISQRLLNEVSAARVCLLSAKKKAAYDQALREKLATEAADDQKEAVAPELIGLGQETLRSSASRLSKISGSSTQPQPATRLPKLYLAAGAGALLVVAMTAWMRWPSRRPPAPPAGTTAQVAASGNPNLSRPFDHSRREGLSTEKPKADVTDKPGGPGSQSSPLAPAPAVPMALALSPKPQATETSTALPPASDQPLAESQIVWLDELEPARHTEYQSGALKRRHAASSAHLKIAGKSYSRGLGTHAPAETVYALDGHHSRFQAECGVDDQDSNKNADVGSCVFEVWGDGKKLFESGIVRRRQPAASVSVDTKGVRELRLVVTTAGDNDWCDHADWGEARLILAESPPLSPPAKMVTKLETPPTPAGPSSPKSEPTAASQAKPAEATSQQPPVSSGDKSPVPSEAAQEQAQKIVAETYQEAFHKAKTNEEKAAVAQRMLDQAAKSGDDRDGRFVLLRLARDVAAAAGDVGTATKAIDQLSEAYAISGPQMRLESLSIASKKTRTPAARKAIAEGAMAGIDQAILNGEFAGARDLIKLAIAEAGKARERDLVQHARARIKEIDEAEKDYAKADAARAVLKEKPNDPEANLTVGRYLCLALGDWDRGLPMLAKGNDETLRSLAEKDLAQPTTSDAQVALADGWWDVSEKEAASAKKQIKVRAGYWYHRALADITGIARTKVEKRMEILRPLLAQQKLPAEILNKTDGSKLILIPSGKFLAGRDKFPVDLPAYYIGLHEVTNTQYKRFIDATGRRAPNVWRGGSMPANRGDHPVTAVSWNDIDAYCKWAGLRLPSELEWEKAARGTDGREYPWGDQWDPSRLVTTKEYDFRPAISHPEACSPWGLYHMSGNVWEWSADWIEADRYARYRRGDLRPPAPADKKIICGGASGHGPESRHCTSRYVLPPDREGADIGFRVAKSVVK